MWSGRFTLKGVVVWAPTGDFRVFGTARDAFFALGGIEGHETVQPLMKRFGIPGTVRASFAVYNTKEEIDVMVTRLRKAIKMLS